MNKRVFFGLVIGLVSVIVYFHPESIFTAFSSSGWTGESNESTNIYRDSIKSESKAKEQMSSVRRYACEDDLIEVMFAWESRVRLRKGKLVDLATDALAGVDEVLKDLAWFEWYRICDVPEEHLDKLQSQGEANTGKPVYNLNNIYRLRVPKGVDVWKLSEELESLPGIILARPVPKPMPLPLPSNYEPQQNYLDPASSTPTGIDARYAWTQTGGNGTGVTVCDLEYSWNYNHGDITKAVNSRHRHIIIHIFPNIHRGAEQRGSR